MEIFPIVSNSFYKSTYIMKYVSFMMLCLLILPHTVYSNNNTNITPSEYNYKNPSMPIGSQVIYTYMYYMFIRINNMIIM